MRRIQIHIHEDMDDDLAREAIGLGISKAELIRRRLAGDGSADRPQSETATAAHPDAADQLIGAYEGNVEDSASVNRVVYGL